MQKKVKIIKDKKINCYNSKCFVADNNNPNTPFRCTPECLEKYDKRRKQQAERKLEKKFEHIGCLQVSFCINNSDGDLNKDHNSIAEKAFFTLLDKWPKEHLKKSNLFISKKDLKEYYCPYICIYQHEKLASFLEYIRFSKDDVYKVLSSKSICKFKEVNKEEKKKGTKVSISIRYPLEFLLKRKDIPFDCPSDIYFVDIILFFNSDPKKKLEKYLLSFVHEDK